MPVVEDVSGNLCGTDRALCYLDAISKDIVVDYYILTRSVHFNHVVRARGDGVVVKIHVPRRSVQLGGIESFLHPEPVPILYRGFLEHAVLNRIEISSSFEGTTSPL